MAALDLNECADTIRAFRRIADQLWSTPIARLGLTIGLRRALIGAGYTVIGDLVRATRQDLLRIPGIGPATLGTLAAHLDEYGLQLADVIAHDAPVSTPAPAGPSAVEDRLSRVEDRLSLLEARTSDLSRQESALKHALATAESLHLRLSNVEEYRAKIGETLVRLRNFDELHETLLNYRKDVQALQQANNCLARVEKLEDTLFGMMRYLGLRFKPGLSELNFSQTLDERLKLKKKGFFSLK